MTPPHMPASGWIQVLTALVTLANTLATAVLHHRQQRLRRRLRAERRLVRHVPQVTPPPAGPELPPTR